MTIVAPQLNEDLFDNKIFTVTLTLRNSSNTFDLTDAGTIEVRDDGGATINTNNTPSITIIGSQSQVNTALINTWFNPAQDYTADLAMRYTQTDNQPIPHNVDTFFAVNNNMVSSEFELNTPLTYEKAATINLNLGAITDVAGDFNPALIYTMILNMSIDNIVPVGWNNLGGLRYSFTGTKAECNDELEQVTFTMPSATFGSIFSILYEQSVGALFQGSGNISVEPAAPIASFTFVKNNLEILFTDTSFTGAGPITNWAWNFGDGTTSTEQNPINNYAAEGTYNVTLTVTNSLGFSDTIVNQVVVAFNSPTASWTVTFPSVNSVIGWFSASASTAGPGATITGYSWDFGDGTNGVGRDPNHTYTTLGEKTVTMTVTNSFGKTDTLAKNVTVIANPPIVTFDYVANQEVVTFNSDRSLSGAGSITAYLWDFGDGTTSTQQNPTKTYTTAGSKIVTLTLTNSFGLQNSKSETINIVVPAPVASFTFAESASNPAVFNFTSTSSAGAGTISSYSWNFGDGTTSTLANPTKTFTSNGAKTVSLTVTNSFGVQNSTSQQVVVDAADPVADFTYAIKSNRGFEFASSSFGGLENTITGYLWDFGDGTTSTSPNPSKTYTISGDFTVSLTVTNSASLQDTYSRTVKVVLITQTGLMNNLGNTASAFTSFAANGDTWVGAMGGTSNNGGWASRSTDNGATWTALPRSLNIGSFGINSVAASGNTWIALGNSGSSRSTDNGATWTALPPVSGISLAPNRSVANNGDTWVAVGDQGWASISADDGATWTALPQGLNSGLTTAGFRSVFASGDVWVAVGDQGRASRSTNNGATWTALPQGLNSGLTTTNFRSVFASGDVWVAVTSAGWASRSTDNGVTWTALPRGLNNTNTTANFTSVAAYGNTWVAVALGGWASRSTDSGATWTALPLGLNSGAPNISLNAIKFSSNGKCLAGGDLGAVTASTDGGATWSNQTLFACLKSNENERVALMTILANDSTWITAGPVTSSTRTNTVTGNWQNMFNVTNVWGLNSLNTVIGTGQSNVRSTDGGLTWSNISGTVRSGTIQSSGSTWITANNSSQFTRSIDDGLTWSLLPDRLGISLDGNSIFEISANANTWIITTNRDEARSTNGGATWSRITISPDVNEAILSLSFIEDTWIAFGSKGNVYESLNDGLDWTKIFTYPGEPAAGVHSTASDGILISVRHVGTLTPTNGWMDISISYDKGNSWYPYQEISDFSNSDQGVIASNGNEFVIVTELGKAYHLQFE